VAPWLTSTKRKGFSVSENASIPGDADTNKLKISSKIWFGFTEETAHT
jgi:hypothetical protein